MSQPTIPAEPGPAATPRAFDRRSDEMARWKRRSGKIALFRRVLPWLMLVIVAAVAGWVTLRAVLSARQVDVDAATSAIHMTNPKFYGRDSKGRSFQLVATDAVRDAKNNDVIGLEKPGMTLETGGPEPIKVEGGKGVYREASKMLEVTDGVFLQDGRGSKFRSASAVVDTQAGVVKGEKDVNGEGPLGQIVASSYAVHDGGARVVFSGGVRVHMQGQ